MRPAPARADVWHLRIPAWSAALDQASSVLDDEERARARRYVREVDRRRFVVAHIGLRRLLGTYLGIAPRDVALSRAPCPRCGGPHGRPKVLGTPPPLYFSMAHTADVALFALAAVPVGIDVEAVARSLVVEDVVAALHPDERLAIGSMPPDSRATAALGCWVRKEAYLKGLGTGLGVDPATVRVGCGAAKPVDEPIATDGPEGWTVIDLPAGAGYLAAVALASASSEAPLTLNSHVLSVT